MKEIKEIFKIFNLNIDYLLFNKMILDKNNNF